MNTYLKKMLEHSSWPEAVEQQKLVQESGGRALAISRALKGFSADDQKAYSVSAS
jgi:hypothetical protein